MGCSLRVEVVHPDPRDQNYIETFSISQNQSINSDFMDRSKQSVHNLRVDLGADSRAITIRKRHDQRHHNPGRPVTVGYRMFRLRVLIRRTLRIPVPEPNCECCSNPGNPLRELLLLLGFACKARKSCCCNRALRRMFRCPKVLSPVQPS